MDTKKLRDYQKDILGEIDSLVESGEQSFFLQSAMGTGKTVCLNAFCEKYATGRVLVVSTRDGEIAFTRDFTVEYNFFTYDKLYSLYKEDIDNFKLEFLGKYSVIVIDEAHRSGAELYSLPLKLLKEEGKWDFFVGASAHVRRTDQVNSVEDMADVLFDGNRVGELNLDYCFENGILMEPEYYICVPQLDAQMREAAEKIKSAKMPSYVKATLLKEINDIQLSYSNYSSLSKTLERGFKNYKDFKDLKILVFINRVSGFKEASSIFIKGISEALGIDSSELDVISFLGNDSKEKLTRFLDEPGRGVVFAIDKCNLSIHHPNLRVAIAYRKTQSAIVYEQQLGRILFRDRVGCFIDIVNNAKTVKPLEYTGVDDEEYNMSGNPRLKVPRFREKISNEFTTHYLRYTEILSIISSKSYVNSIVEYNGEVKTVQEFAKEYQRVLDDTTYYMKRGIVFERALLASRREYYITVNDIEYSASEVASILKLDPDVVRWDIRNGMFSGMEELRQKLNV